MTVSSESLVLEALQSTNQDEVVSKLRAIPIDSDGARLAKYHLGVIYAGRGLHRRAADTLKEVLDRFDPDDPAIWFLYARQLQLAEVRDEALKAYEQVVRLDPLCEKAFLYTAEILLEERREPARSLACAQAAISLRNPSSMVEEDAFEQVLGRAREFAATQSGQSPMAQEAPSRDMLRQTPLGHLIAEEPAVADALTLAGIRCITCAGYSGQSIAEIAPEWGMDPDELIDAVLSMLEPDQTELE